MTAGELAGADLFREWAKAAEGTALVRNYRGDRYSANLARARSAAYWEAATLADTQRPDDVVCGLRKLMSQHQHLTRESSCRMPMKKFDAAGIFYVKARAYQLCAQALDPSVPEVQPSWH